jgi:hypothetical protein
LSLPLVYLGLVKDFWEPFDWYLKVEKGLPATYFLIPYKRRVGANVNLSYAVRRATGYDVTDVPESVSMIAKAGCELGVHGIDAWHSAEKGREEMSRVAGMVGASNLGVRMHWLLWNSETPSTLEKAGYTYDSTAGYNETIGYRNGTGQVFRPAGAQSLLELPLHIQDGALFFNEQLDLSEPEAERRCHALIAHAEQVGGVLTVLWHDRSHGPERFWGDFYIALMKQLRASLCWFGTSHQVVEWFRRRRSVVFHTVSTPTGLQADLRYVGPEISPPLVIRRYERTGVVDVAWNGVTTLCSDPHLV